jgi:hypothetical protein
LPIGRSRRSRKNPWAKWRAVIASRKGSNRKSHTESIC